jgi:hypothetical protein
MAEPPHLDHIFREWPYDPNAISVRMVPGDDGREVIQLRLDMGLLQLEPAGRPDGEKPEGFETYFDALKAKKAKVAEGEEYTLGEEECEAADREFLQFHRRRICWIALREYVRAVQDADHTLALMDFCRDHSPDDEWTISHEQSRTYVLFHRTQASALSELESNGGGGPEGAIVQLNAGLDRIKAVFAAYDAEEEYEEDELVQRLIELRESLREQYAVGRTLDEQLHDAIKSEQYELAARLRDEISKGNSKRQR